MGLYDRHIVKSLLLSCLLLALILVGVVMLAQSIRFLEVVLQSGAPIGSFFTLMALAMPRFLEIVLPIGLFGGTLFFYQKILSDSELVILRSAGRSSLSLASPALLLSTFMGLVIFLITAWLAPVSLAKLQALQHQIRAKYSALILQEGVFTALDNGLTFYVEKKSSEGALSGIMVYDDRPENTDGPSLITAQSGVGYSAEDAQKIVVYNGTRQNFNPKSGVVSRLDFDQYAITLPSNDAPLDSRWQEPNERTLWALFNPDMDSSADRRHAAEMIAEAHRRIGLPFLGVSYTMIALITLLLGPISRRGYSRRIGWSIAIVIFVQGLYLTGYNISKSNIYGLAILYGAATGPIITGLFLMSPWAETLRRSLFFRPQTSAQTSGGQS